MFVTDLGDLGYTNFTLSFYQSESEPPIIDTTFTVTLPTGWLYAYFSPQNSSSYEVAPTGQASDMPFFNITNTGSIAQTFYLALNQTRTGIILEADDDSTPADSNTIATSKVAIKSSLAAGGNCGIWLWSNFSYLAVPQNSSSTLNISVT